MLPTIADLMPEHAEISAASKTHSGLHFAVPRPPVSPKTDELITRYKNNLNAELNNRLTDSSEPIWWQITGSFPRLK
jgi:hypothetical protein